MLDPGSFLEGRFSAASAMENSKGVCPLVSTIG